MTIAYVNSGIAQGLNSASIGATDMTGANFFGVTVGCNLVPATTDITDSAGNSYAARTAYADGVFGAFQKIFYSENATSLSNQTFTVTKASFVGTFAVAGYSGVATSSSYDGNENGNTASTSPCTTGSVTPSVDGCLLLFGCAVAWTGNLSVNVGTLRQSAALSSSYAGSLADQIQTTATARNPSFSYSGSSTAASIAVFKPTATAAAASGSTNLLMGV